MIGSRGKRDNSQISGGITIITFLESEGFGIIMAMRQSDRASRAMQREKNKHGGLEVGREHLA